MPLRELTGVFHLCVSKNLRRLTVDMASYCSFEQAVVRMKEHHGVDLNASLVRKITLQAGEAAAEILDAEVEKPISERSGMLIMQMDGVMVPVTSSMKSSDRRKTKTVQYQEMKVGIIRKPEAIESLSACSFEGADLLGKRLGKLLSELGGDASTKVHGLGDGALWIPEQGEQIAGCNYSHLIDFYHFAEYLYDAFEGDLRRDLKVSRSKQEAKAGQMSKVMRRLYRRAKEHPDHEGVKACISYIKNRANQFKYAEAIAKELPIGSGEVESANRSLIQQRLKLPGCWWLRENASKIACLRVVRANNGWNKLWARAA